MSFSRLHADTQICRYLAISMEHALEKALLFLAAVGHEIVLLVDPATIAGSNVQSHSWCLATAMPSGVSELFCCYVL